MLLQRIVQRQRVLAAAADAQPLGEVPELLFLERDVVAELSVKFPQRQDAEGQQTGDRGVGGGQRELVAKRSPEAAEDGRGEVVGFAAGAAAVVRVSRVIVRLVPGVLVQCRILP